ncbi:MAG: hypothetical protein ACON5F_15205 [Jejuia sp.]
MKKILLSAAIVLLSLSASADDKINTSLNIMNPDVRKCLLEASKADGWELMSVYLDEDEKIVMIFGKGKEEKIYKSK